MRFSTAISMCDYRNPAAAAVGLPKPILSSNRDKARNDSESNLGAL